MLPTAKIHNWMAAHKPHTLAAYVMPYLVVLLTIVAFLSAGAALSAHQIATENHRIIEANTQTANALCVNINEQKRIVRRALLASLTEADVQANNRERLAFESIVKKWAVPTKC